jgi:hypothetical protein
MSVVPLVMTAPLNFKRQTSEPLRSEAARSHIA